MALLGRIWSGGRRRAPRTIDAFCRANEYRRAGRVTEALELATWALSREPNNVTGHMLAGSLHLARRALAPARTEFRWVLDRDPHHPRALLGVARVALEEGDAATGRESLQRALGAWPDFPEAQALLAGLAVRPAAPTPASTVRLLLRVDRLQPPGAARGLALARVDGAVLTALPGPAQAWATVERPARVLGLAGATLARAGLGALRRAVVEDAQEAVFVRTDGEHLLTLAMPPDTEIAEGILHLHRLWATAGHELELATAAARGRPQARRRAS